MAKKTVAIDIEVQVGDLESKLQELEDKFGDLVAQNEELKQKIESGFDAAEKGAKNASTGFKKVGGSIGSVIKSLGLLAIAAEVFVFLKETLMQNQVVMDAVNTATTALQILFQKLFESVSALAAPMKAAFEDPKQAVLNLWETIKENLINRMQGIILQFKALGSVMIVTGKQNL